MSAGAASGVVVAVEQLRRQVPGGIGRYAQSVLGALAGLGPGAPPLTLVASRHLGAGPDPLDRFGFAVAASPLPAPFLTLAWDRGLGRLRGGPFAVHAVSPAAPPVRPRSAGGPALVVTVHDLAWRHFPEATTPRGRRWHEAALRRALRRADAFVVPSAPVAAELAAAGAGDRVRVIAHGADHLPAPDPAGAAALLGRLGVGTEGYLLCAGTLEPRKNLGRLLQAYARARAELAAPWPLVVVGPPGWGDAGLAPVEGAVAAGAVPDAVLAALYGGARAFCYVPLLEGFGLPPLEAMACGTPVVSSTAVPSTDPAPGTEPAAVRVDPCSVGEIAAALVAAASDEDLRATLVARGRALVAPATWARSAAAHVGLWESLR